MKKIIILALSLALALAGCGDSPGTGNRKTSDKKVEAFSYPMEGKHFTYWVKLDPNVGQTASNLGMTPFAKALEEATGVTVEYQHPASGTEREQFNLMVASDTLPDIFEFNVLGFYPGGPEKALEDGTVTDLTDRLRENAPNLSRFYTEHPDIAKMAETDTGKFYSFPFVRGDDSLMVYFGPVVNSAWLKDLGLDYPETIEEWHKMLTLFKLKKGAAAPLTYEPWMIMTGTGSPFIGAFGIAEDFYLDEKGSIRFGSIMPQYKSFLETFHQWYAEGLIDPDIETMNSGLVAEKMTTGESGASIGYLGSRMGKWLTAVENRKDIDFAGVRYPVVKKGDIPRFSQKDFPITGTGDAFISGNCDDAESAMRYLDYAYSAEGNMLFNFGIEGESYEMTDAYPTYTDKVMKNPALEANAALAQFTRAIYYGPFVQDKEYFEQYGFTFPAKQSEALGKWNVTETEKTRLPKLTPTPEESQELALIMNDITTYRDEMQVKYIMGIEGLDSYDAYVRNIKDMGIDRAIEIYEAALTRYKAR